MFDCGIFELRLCCIRDPAGDFVFPHRTIRNMVNLPQIKRRIEYSLGQHHDNFGLD